MPKHDYNILPALNGYRSRDSEGDHQDLHKLDLVAQAEDRDHRDDVLSVRYWPDDRRPRHEHTCHVLPQLAQRRRAQPRKDHLAGHLSPVQS